MNSQTPFSRTVRIAIPVPETQPAGVKVPKVSLKGKPAGQTSWIVTTTGDAGSNRFQELLHSLYDGVLVTDSSGRIVDVNARAIK
ncbi:MAG: PAS domain-containing protein, partial [Kiritimatiellia bacterium]